MAWRSSLLPWKVKTSTMVDYFYVSGDPVDTGNAGDTDYFFASGEPVPNAGESGFAFETGTAIGGGVNIGVLGWWKFDDETDLTVAVDEEGVNDGDIQGPSYVSGKDGTALDFERSNGDTVEFGNTPFTASQLASHTFTMWVNLESLPSQAGEIFNVFDHGDAPELEINQNDKLRYNVLQDGNATATVSTSTLTTGTWTFFAGRLDSGDMALFFNDQKEDTNTLAGSIDVRDRPFRFGATYSDSNTRNFDGLLDDVRLWERALSDEEIIDLYNSY